jgi:hypothetical protein
MNILKVIPSTDVNTKRIILEFPTLPQSPIGVEYNKIVHILHNNIDINYDNIFDRLYIRLIRIYLIIINNKLFLF